MTNKEFLPASDEQMLYVVDNFETVCHSLGPFLRHVLLAYDNACCVNKYFTCVGNFDS